MSSMMNNRYSWMNMYKVLMVSCLLHCKHHVDGFSFNNPLKRIIMTKAITTTFVENISAEFFDTSTMVQHVFMGINSNYLVLYLIGYYWFNVHTKDEIIKKYKYMDEDKLKERKLMSFESYTITKKIVRQFMIICLLILTKNIDRVY